MARVNYCDVCNCRFNADDDCTLTSIDIDINGSCASMDIGEYEE